MDRRRFLLSLGAATTAGAWSTPALAAGTWHVAYPGTDNLHDARELQHALAVQLGPVVAKQLRIARLEGKPVVIYDRSDASGASDAARAKAVASRHQGLLKRALDDPDFRAAAVSVSELADVYDVRYGAPGTVASLKPAYDRVSQLLGPGVAKSLVIEEQADGAHRLVYKRGGDLASTRDVAAKHDRLLTRAGLDAVAVPDTFLSVSFDGSTASHSPVGVAKAAPEKVDDPGDTGLVATSRDEPFDDLVDAYVKRQRSAGRVSSVERTAWLVHDLLADTTLCAINADASFQAASMIKPWVAIAFFHQVERGRMVYGPKSTANMVKMIRDSSNTSTNWLMEQVGGPSAVHRIVHANYGRYADAVKVVEYIPSDGRTYRNKASARDHARLLRGLWKGDLPGHEEILRVMNLPGPDRLYQGVDTIPVGTAVYNKTGTTAMCCGDMGILVARRSDGRRVPYVVVGIIERNGRSTSYGSWYRTRGNVIRGVSGVVYSAFKQRYGLV